jgi:CheY-like chemotaxis protein
MSDASTPDTPTCAGRYTVDAGGPTHDADQIRKILVIEDEIGIRRALLHILKLEGYHVAEAAHGEAGWDVVMEERPDLIICDVEMPELNGYEFLARLKSTPEVAEVPFMFLTGKALLSDVERGLAMGPDDYLIKPFTRAEILLAIDRLETHLRDLKA